MPVLIVINKLKFRKDDIKKIISLSHELYEKGKKKYPVVRTKLFKVEEMCLKRWMRSVVESCLCNMLNINFK